MLAQIAGKEVGTLFYFFAWINYWFDTELLDNFMLSFAHGNLLSFSVFYTLNIRDRKFSVNSTPITIAVRKRRDLL